MGALPPRSGHRGLVGRIRDAPERRYSAPAAPVDERGFPIVDAVAQARYLTSRGVPADRLLLEASSFDTIGNAFFSRVLHAEPRRLRRLLIITSDFHMPRTEMIFRWVYSLPPVPAPWALSFDAVADPRMDRPLLGARLEKEEQSMEALSPLIARMETLQQFHQWMFSEHVAYSASGLLQPRPRLDAALADSY